LWLVFRAGGGEAALTRRWGAAVGHAPILDEVDVDEAVEKQPIGRWRHLPGRRRVPQHLLNTARALREGDEWVAAGNVGEVPAPNPTAEDGSVLLPIGAAVKAINKHMPPKHFLRTLDVPHVERHALDAHADVERPGLVHSVVSLPPGLEEEWLPVDGDAAEAESVVAVLGVVELDEESLRMVLGDAQDVWRKPQRRLELLSHKQRVGGVGLLHGPDDDSSAAQGACLVVQGPVGDNHRRCPR
jgi:hypothetical protein